MAKFGGTPPNRTGNREDAWIRHRPTTFSVSERRLGSMKAYCAPLSGSRRRRVTEFRRDPPMRRGLRCGPRGKTDTHHTPTVKSAGAVAGKWPANEEIPHEASCWRHPRSSEARFLSILKN